MANLNKPFGLSPLHNLGAATWNQRASKYRYSLSDTNALYIGDAVTTSAGADANGIPDVAKAGGTATLRGVVVGVEKPPSNMNSIQGTTPVDDTTTSIPAGTVGRATYYVFVVDDPHCMFTVQDDGYATSVIAANANKNFSLTIAAPTYPQQVSATVMNASTLAVTQGLNMKAIGLEQIPGNGFSAYAVWQCVINQHELMGNTAGI